jgi:glycerol-3-phosphate O-acyltransferase
MAEASDMLKELQARPNQGVLKGMKVALEWGFNRIYRGIEFDQADVDRLRKASRDGALILLPSHKSHIDYLVLSYFFYSRNLMIPVIAAGDNLNFQPVGPIFRRCGAFFIRRSFKGDRLYAAVVDAYVRRLIRDGFPIELFLEGGRSRNGRLLEPKLGLLNMIVDAALGVPGQKVHFVPVSIGYERVIEADTYEHELAGGEKKKEEATDLLSAREVLGHRYGRISLQFGTIMTLADVSAELGIDTDEIQRPAKRRAVVTRLGNRVMDEINRVTAVTPGALTAMALLSGEKREMTENEVFAICSRLLLVLRRREARISSTLADNPAGIMDLSIREALQMFIDAQLLDNAQSSHGSSGSSTSVYKIVESKRVQLDTSKNIIIHFFVQQGLIACALDRQDEGQILPTPVEKVRQRVLWASRVFKHEFRFRADASFDEVFDGTVEFLCQEGHLLLAEEAISPGKGEAGWSGQDWLDAYRAILAAVFEGYLVAVHSLGRLFGGPRTEKDLVKGGLSEGDRLRQEGKIRRREAVSKPVILNAYHSLTELGYIQSRAGKLELSETYKSRDALDELESMFMGFLTGKHEVNP